MIILHADLDLNITKGILKKQIHIYVCIFIYKERERERLFLLEVQGRS